MSHDLARLRRANDILASGDYGPTLGPRIQSSGFARYQIFYSEDLWTATPLLDSSGAPRMEFICRCGVDRQIHAPSCNGLTLASTMFIKVKVDPRLHNVFTLCTWLPPPDESSWANIYGSFRYYPRNGRYVPITINGNYLQLPYPPFEEVARKIVVMIRDHEATKEFKEAEALRKLELREALKTRDYTPGAGSAFQRNRDAFKSAMTMHGQRPGTKGSVSYGSHGNYGNYGGAQLINQPDPLRDSQLPANPAYSAQPEKKLIEIAH